MFKFAASLSLTRVSPRLMRFHAIITASHPMNRTIKKSFQLAQFNLRGIFISTYIPRRCGIATYTKDLTNAMNVLNPNYLNEVMALSDKREKVDYPWEVKYRINKDTEKDYFSALEYLNKSSCDYVSLQHEYGIFGGESGEFILNMIQNIKKPLITTFHTTLSDPTPKQAQILKEIAKKSKMCVVMINEAARRLKKIYGIPNEKILAIPHGVPNTPFSPSNLFKDEIGMSTDTFLIGAINLVAPNKGLEYIVKALPQIKKHHSKVKFVMIGQTHPMIKSQLNEEYRKMLRSLVKKKGLEANFVEINEYISLDDLVRYLKTFDVYITPYLDLNQTSSGTLAYAIGAGKVCISTPYIYAKETLGSDRGIIIPPQSADEIANAVIDIIKHPKKRAQIEKRAYEFGRRMIWEHVALDYLQLFDYVVNK